jgi:hypothetical protein
VAVPCHAIRILKICPKFGDIFRAPKRDETTIAIKLIVDNVESSIVKSALELIYTGQTKTDDPKSVASFLASLGIRLDNLETEESDRQLESDRQNRDRSGELDRKIDDFKTLTREFIDKRGQEIEAVTHQQKTVNTVLNIKAEPNSQPETQTTSDLSSDPELSSSEQNDVLTEPELNTDLETDLTDQTSNSENTLDQETNSDFPIDVDIESNSNEETDNDFHMVIIFCNNNFAKMIL